MMLTTEQVAQRLGVHRTRVHQLIMAGRLPAQRFGRVWQVDEAAVERFARQDRQPGRPRKY
jgi:excisionase family DNA binding protein